MIVKQIPQGHFAQQMCVEGFAPEDPASRDGWTAHAMGTSYRWLADAMDEARELYDRTRLVVAHTGEESELPVACRDCGRAIPRDLTLCELCREIELDRAEG